MANCAIPHYTEEILHNPGCGIFYLQRGRNKVRFDEVPADAWFLREKLTDKISFSLAWSVLEPEEGKFLWEHPDWEGCINSWIDAGFKVSLQIRGMDTWGTLYNDGVPQWVFDAGAKYIDEPMALYRNSFTLNFLSDDSDKPVRYPVYWDKVYLEKVRHLVKAMGERYNGRSEVASVSIGHMGRWGEMHLSGHSPLQPWFDAGFSRETYIKAHKEIIDIYRNAFPDTELVQEICAPVFAEETGRDLIGIDEVPEIYDYLAEHGICIKFNGIGKSWRPSSDPYLDRDVAGIFDHYAGKTKICCENLVTPAGLASVLNHQISCWQRGGETEGLGILMVDRDIPLKEKRIYSYLTFFPEEFAALTPEGEKELWRMMARRCGYRIVPESVEYDRDGNLAVCWKNIGTAPCYEPLRTELLLPAGRTLARCHTPTILPVGKQTVCRFRLPAGTTGSLRIRLVAERYGEVLELPLDQRDPEGYFKVEL